MFSKFISRNSVLNKSSNSVYCIILNSGVENGCSANKGDIVEYDTKITQISLHYIRA